LDEQGFLHAVAPRPFTKTTFDRPTFGLKAGRRAAAQRDGFRQAVRVLTAPVSRSTWATTPAARPKKDISSEYQKTSNPAAVGRAVPKWRVSSKIQLACTDGM
jgi:hypothetical protein